MTRKELWIVTIGCTIPILLITAIIISGHETQEPVRQEWTIREVVTRCGQPLVIDHDKYGNPNTLVYRAQHGSEFRLRISEDRIRLNEYQKIEDLPCLASHK